MHRIFSTSARPTKPTHVTLLTVLLGLAPLASVHAQTTSDDANTPPAPAAPAAPAPAEPAPAAAAPAAAAPAAAAGAAAAAPAASVSAGSASASAPTTDLGSVAVTGTAIARADAATALPVTVIQAEQLRQQGITSTEQVLAQLPQNNSGFGEGFGTGVNEPAGANFADLRGLGPKHTLVLLNGRRLSNDAINGGAVDVNTIPFGAIERVEVLRDGASALYGTDAVGGVINFITKKNLQGGSVATGYETPTRDGGGTRKDLEVTFGHGDLDTDRYNVMITGQYRRQDAVSTQSRTGIIDPIQSGRGQKSVSSYPYPANYGQGASALYNPLRDGGCDTSQLTPRDSDSCGFLYSQYGNVVNKSDRASVFARGAFKFNDRNQVSLSYLFAHDENTVQSAPGGTFNTPPLSIDASRYFTGANALTAPDDVDPSQPIDIYWRAVPFGPRLTDNTNEAHRVVLDFTGRFFEKVHYDTAFSYSQSSTTRDYRSGYFDTDVVADAFESGAINPFSTEPLTAAGRQAAADAAITGQIEAAKGRTYNWDGKLTRTIGNWFGAGASALALGAQYRHEELAQSVNNAIAQAGLDSGGGVSPADPVSADRDVESVYGELNIPILDSLELTAAGRYDNYSDVGDTVNPKVELRWQPVEQLVFRGSYSEGFSAPTLYELSDPISRTQSGVLNDPLYCPGGTPTANAPGRVCRQQFLLQQSGNPNLEPETSKNWTAGVIVQPLDNLSATVDFWWIELHKQVQYTPASYVLNNNPDAIVRDNNGSILYVNDAYANLGSTETHGIDFALNYHLDTDYGTFGLSFNGTYTAKYDYQNVPGGQYFSAVGQYNDGTTPIIPNWSHRITLSWAKAGWSGQIVNHYFSEYTDEYPDLHKTVDDYSTWDVAGSYKFDNGIQFTVGSRNVFDTDPPFSNQQDIGQPGYDARYADALGRTVYGRLSYEF